MSAMNDLLKRRERMRGVGARTNPVPSVEPAQLAAAPVRPINILEAARKRMSMTKSPAPAPMPNPAPGVVPSVEPHGFKLVSPIATPISASSVGSRLTPLERMRAGLRNAVRAPAAVAAIRPINPPKITPGSAPDSGAPDQLETSVVAPKPLSARERLRLAVAASSQTEFDNAEFDGEVNDSDSEARASAPNSIEVSGVLNSVRVFNDWALGSLWTSDREEVRLTGGILNGLNEGLEYKFVGVMKSSRHGEALDVSAYEPIISVDAQALQRYMVKSFSGVGPIKAEKFIRKTGDDAVEKLIADRADSAPSDEDRSKARLEALAALRDKMLHSPWEIDLSALVSKQNLEDGHDPQAAAKHVVLTRNLMLRLGGQQGFRENVAKTLATYLLAELHADAQESQGDLIPITDLVEQSWTKLVTNPYKPIRNAPGYGFGMAEVIARFVGIPKDAGMRLSALSEFAVDQACQSRGHVFLKPADFIDAVKKVDPLVDAQSTLNHALREKLVIIDLEKKRLYTPKLHATEMSLAKNLAKLLEPSEPLTKRSVADVKKFLVKNAAKINPAFENGIGELQLEAVASMLTSPTRLHVLTGGPGTGKTSIIECAVYVLKQKEFLFTAPTGKAAKVLASRVKSLGHTASTIHSLLKGGPEDGFQVNEENPLKCDVLVVDESTMNGIELADALLKAISSNAHVIFLGDPGRRATEDAPGRAGQLPSISPGRFMLDLIEINGVNHVNLSHTYRNSGGILEVVNEVGDSKLGVKDRESVFFHGLPGATEGFPGLMREYIECVLRDGIANTLLVMPKRKGDRDTPDWNTTYANAVLRAVINPQGQKLPGTTLAIGDRILIRQNLKIEQPDRNDMGRTAGSIFAPGAFIPMGFDLEALKKPFSLDFASLANGAGRGEDDDDSEPFDIRVKDEKDIVTERVVNGDTGTIIAYSMDPRNPRMGSPQWVRLALDDGRQVEFPGEEMACLDLAYALTVHAAQGSEYQNVIMAVTPGTAHFMNQNMLFTGFSRAKKHLSIYGTPRDLVKISATVMPDRNSALVERLVEQLNALKDDPEPEQSDHQVA